MQNIPNYAIYLKNNKLRVSNFFSKNKRLIIPLLFVLSYLLFYFLVDFSSQSLVAHDEGLYARRSRLVEESYNWFSSPFSSPHHKTIGSYWLIALSIRLFGNNELALRLPSILSSFLCLIISYFIALKIANRKSALISVFSLSSMPLWIQYSRYASPDLQFVLSILLVIFFFLKFLDCTRYTYKYFYVFLSGLFMATSFFIRSYMAFVPILGLTPFLLFNLSRTKNIYKSVFFIGIIFGSIPTLFNFYYSYKKFGIEGLTALFDFARKQAIDGIHFDNFLLIPLNFLYLTFPIGILFIILLIFTRSNNNINFPLLVYFYPLFSLTLLLSMSTSYPHYFLFLLPSLSILFAVRLEAYLFRFSFSRKIIKNIMFLSILIVGFLLVCLAYYYSYSLIGSSYKQTLLVYIVVLLLVLSFIFSLQYLCDNRNYTFDLVKFLYSIIIPQFVSISLLYNFGVLGNPNSITKTFLNDKYVSSIVNSNTIYLYNVDSKTKTLLSYYLPSSSVLKSSEDIFKYNYIITSDRNLLYRDKYEKVFKLIKDFDNHLFLMNISKENVIPN